MTHTLSFVRSVKVVTVPPVCTVLWSETDWALVTRRVVEPLVMDALGRTWVSTGERNERGDLLYRCA